MVKRVIATVLLLTLVTVVVVQAMEPEKPKDNLPGIAIGEKAPDFELKTLTGDTVKLSDYQGKKVMLNFWATWCPPCKEEMPDMEQFYQENGEEVVILAINIDPRSNVQKFVSEMGITFPVLLDEKDVVNSQYQILTIPTTYFIDKEGIIRKKHLSAMTLELMKRYTDEL